VNVTPRDDAYSPAEIALAAGVPVERVLTLIGDRRFVPYGEALRIGQTLAGSVPFVEAPLFSIFSPSEASRLFHQLFLVASGSVHAVVIAAAIVLAMSGALTGPLATNSAPADAVHLVFLAEPGPGGGGGGGGRGMDAPPPPALREGRSSISSPLPVRPPPKPIEPVLYPVEQPLKAEPLPAVIAPLVSAPADASTRLGVLTALKSDVDSLGRGGPNGVGSGTGTGTGSGEGPGVGPGSGGGAGGGPYRGGSGIEPPRLVREVKADYSEEGRRRGVTGDVILEIVVRRDGAVGDAKLLKGLGWGLDERAIQAVRQWRFSPATRSGTPIDVVVEVAVEFKLR
jgi:TonB family protein